MGESRFKLIRAPEALPGHCAVCGKPICDEGFVDTELQFEFFGAVIFCYECVADMAAQFGFITPDIANALKNRVDSLEHETITQREALLALEEAVDGLQRARAILSAGNSGDSASIESEAPSISPLAEQGPGDFMVEGADNLIADGESETDDTNSEQRPISVSSGNGGLADSASIGLDL